MKSTCPTAIGVAVALSMLGGNVTADPHRQVKLEIGSQVLRDALIDWARQTGYQLILPSSSIAGEIIAPAIDGTLTAESALQKLLVDTPLTFEWLDDRTVAIHARHNDGVTHLKLSMPLQPADSIAFRRVASTDETAVQQRSLHSDRAPARQTGAERSMIQLDIEELVVTAQKREERLQDVPISISVLSGEALDASAAQGVTEALSRVPGVATSLSLQSGGTQLTVRGVTAAGPLFFGSSPVAYYLDSVPFGFVRSAVVPDSNAYDLERVEVLRGPQGTLYGASALNGVVRVLTKNANLDEFELKARVAGATVDDGGQNYRGDMAVNLPIVSGKVAIRGVAGYENLGGWIDRSGNDDANGAELRNFRLKVNAQPAEGLSVGLSAWLSRADYDAPSVGDDFQRHRATLDESIAVDYDALGLSIDYELPWFSVSSMTSYLDYRNESFLDYGVLGLAGTRFQTILDNTVRAQEIILNSNSQGAWRWSLGGIYRDVEDGLFQFRQQYVMPTRQTFTSESFAVFGEITRTFFDGRLELTGGIRYFEDEVGLDEDSRFTGVAATELVHSESDFDATTPRAIVTWHATDQVMVYGSYAEGFRSGLAQQPSVLVIAPGFPPADPDSLQNYELGTKGSLLDGRIGFEAAIYYMDWKDVQQSLTVEVSPGIRPAAIVNGESASGIGADFSLTGRVADPLTLSLNFSWNDLTMDADVFSGGVLIFDKGDRLNTSPEYTVAAAANYVADLGGSGYQGRLSLSANYTSELEVRTLVGTTRQVAIGDSMLLGRASFGIHSPLRWSATLFVENITNEQDSPLRSTVPFRDWDSRIAPRTFGIQFEYRL